MSEIITLLNRNLPWEEFITHLHQHLEPLQQQIQKDLQSKDPPQIHLPNYQPTGACLLDQFSQQMTAHLQARSLVHLNEDEEFRTPFGKTKYWLLVADSPEMRKFFGLYLILYAAEAELRHQGDDKNKYSYAGIDYEFNNRQIALMQIHFERIPQPDQETHNYLWILNPDELEEDDYSIMLSQLMRNRNIFKILHGADSLDVPYMFNFMFNDDRETILEFTSRFIDTRFLCEYYLSIAKEHKKCAIYEALLKFETISQKKYEYLHHTHDEMGPVQDISWNINKMKTPERKYAMYDVLYLKKYLFDIYRLAQQNQPYHAPFYRTVNRIAQFVILERRGVSEITIDIKTKIDPIHNYMIRTPKTHTMISIYNKLMVGLKVPEIKLEMDLLLLINYFRTQLVLVMKRLIYGLILKHHVVYSAKTNIYTEQLPVEELYRELKQQKYQFLVEILEKLQQNLEPWIQRWR